MTEEKDFLTLEETAEYIGVKRATVYNYMHDLGITSQHFGRGKKRYIALTDVKRMKAYKEEPWTVETQKKKDAA